jgi:hypothetical protein
MHVQPTSSLSVQSFQKSQRSQSAALQSRSGISSRSGGAIEASSQAASFRIQDSDLEEKLQEISRFRGAVDAAIQTGREVEPHLSLIE